LSVPVLARLDPESKNEFVLFPVFCPIFTRHS